MKITLGALVLCKILVLDPTMPKKDQTSKQTVSASSSNITMSKLADKMNTPQDASSVTVPSGYSERIVTGVVEEIKSKRKLVEVEKNKKFQYKNYHTLRVKTKDLERLVIQADSCALADEIIEDENQDKLKKIEDNKKKLLKKKETIRNNTTSNIDIEDYEELKDEEVLKLYKKYLEEHKKRYLQGDNSVRIVDLSTGKMINLDDTSSEEGLVKKESISIIKKKEEKETKVTELSQDIEKSIEDIKEPEQLNKEKIVINNNEEKELESTEEDVNLFDFFEKQKKEERVALEKQKKQKEELLLKKKKKEEEQAKLAMIKKKQKEEIAYKKFKEENPNMLIEAFKIILFE